MRIAFVGPFGFHPNKTMRSRALPLARALVNRGHRVKMVLPPWQTPAEGGKKWLEDGVEICYVNLAGGIPAITGRMVNEVGQFRAEVVHSFKPKAYSGLVQWWLWMKRSTVGRFGADGPHLITDTDDWEGWGGWNDIAPYSPLQKQFFAWQEKWGLTHCDRLTVASRTLAGMAADLGVPPHRIAYIPNGPGIETGPHPPQVVAARRHALKLVERPVLLLYSRLFEFDLQRLVAVLRQVKSAVPDLAILAIGTGLFAADNHSLAESFGEAGLLEAVVDLGWLSETELPLNLLAADLGLYLMDDTLLNRTKCPVKLADMIALGLPVVGENVGQVSEYIQNGHNGLVFASGDVSGLAKGIIDLLQKPALRQTMGTNGRRLAQASFSWPRLAETLEAVYRSAAGR